MKLKPGTAYLIDWGSRKVIENIEVVRKRVEGDNLVIDVVAHINMPSSATMFVNVGCEKDSHG